MTQQITIMCPTPTPTRPSILTPIESAGTRQTRAASCTPSSDPVRPIAMTMFANSRHMTKMTPYNVKTERTGAALPHLLPITVTRSGVARPSVSPDRASDERYGACRATDRAGQASALAPNVRDRGQHDAVEDRTHHGGWPGGDVEREQVEADVVQRELASDEYIVDVQKDLADEVRRSERKSEADEPGKLSAPEPRPIALGDEREAQHAGREHTGHS